MKLFNLEEASAGKPVCTRDGRDVRIICVDLDGSYPVAGVIDEDIYNEVERWTRGGSTNNRGEEGCNDLFMKEEETLTVCSGSLFFYGADDKYIRSDGVAEPLIRKIQEQITNFCCELPYGEIYGLAWKISREKKPDKLYAPTLCTCSIEEPKG